MPPNYWLKCVDYVLTMLVAIELNLHFYLCTSDMLWDVLKSGEDQRSGELMLHRPDRWDRREVVR